MVQKKKRSLWKTTLMLVLKWLHFLLVYAAFVACWWFFYANKIDQWQMSQWDNLVCIVVFVLLLFFMSVYYINPIYRMLDSIRLYRSSNAPYSYDFPGNDQLHQLNEGITEDITENGTLRKRISAMRHNSEKAGK